MPDQLDIFTLNMEPAGTADKKEVHEQALWHKVTHSWLVCRDPDQLIFQQRSRKHRDGLFTITAGGHIDAGEDVFDASLREVSEEIGLTIPADQWVDLGYFINVKDYKPSYRDQAHHEGHLHQVATVWLLTEYNNNIGIICQQRSPNKEPFAGQLIMISYTQHARKTQHVNPIHSHT